MICSTPSPDGPAASRMRTTPIAPNVRNHFQKRVVAFSPHPDDDVISMGGTLRRLVQQGHEVHVAYETSGNIAVGDEEVVRFMHFINGFNQLFDEKLQRNHQKQIY